MANKRGLVVGVRVRISEGSGYPENTCGVVIPRSEVPMRRDGSGIPDLLGAYNPVDWKRETAVRLDCGKIITMFNNRLDVTKS